MISWKHSFSRLNEEYEMARKKKQALDNLMKSGRISQSTYELFNKEIDEMIAEIERQQKALIDKMSSKIKELEGQIRTLEILLANFEIQHVTGEVEEEVYQRETNLLSIGLETAKHELDAVREAVNQLSSSTQIPTANVVAQQNVEPQTPENVEVSKTEVEGAKEPVSRVEEKLPEPPLENVEVKEAESSQTSQEQPQETLQGKEESQLTEEKTASKENQEA